jgi:membrane protease YdiL (CAAX protease family)
MGALGYGTFRSGLILRVWIPPTNLLLSWPDRALSVFLVLVCLTLGSTWGPGWRQLGWGVGGIERNIALGFVSGGILGLLTVGAGDLALRRYGPDIYSPRLMRAILPASGSEWVGVIPALLISAALEELLFRSLPLAAFGVTAWWVLWPLAFFFGGLHWPQGAWGVVAATLIAVALSMLFLLSRSIWLPLTAHCVANILQLVLAKGSGIRPLREDLGSAP